MRAVNLIPPDERKGAGGAAGRSGGAAYVLLGFLAVLVVLAGVYAVQKKSVSDKRVELARVEAQASAAEARAGSLAAFTAFSGLRTTRTQTIFSLASSRFDWSHALEELARVVPSDVSLTTLNASVAPGSGGGGGGGGASGLRGSLPLPAIEMDGCTSSQVSVARMLKRMRLIDGVTRVALQSSVKPDAAGGAGAAPGGGCAASTEKEPAFALVVFFDPAVGAVPTQNVTADTITGGAP